MALAVVGIAIPFACSIAAIVLGRRAQRAIAHSAEGGRRLAAIGVWLGAFGLGSWIAVAILIAIR